MGVIKTAHQVKNLKNAAFMKDLGLFTLAVCVLVSKAVLWGSVHILFLPPHLSLDPPSLDLRVPRHFHSGLWWDGRGGASLLCPGIYQIAASLPCLWAVRQKAQVKAQTPQRLRFS